LKFSLAIIISLFLYFYSNNKPKLIKKMKSQFFNEEHELFRSSVKLFIDREVMPFADQWEKDEKIPRDLFLK